MWIGGSGNQQAYSQAGGLHRGCDLESKSNIFPWHNASRVKKQDRIGGFITHELRDFRRDAARIKKVQCIWDNSVHMRPGQLIELRRSRFRDRYVLYIRVAFPNQIERLLDRNL